MVLAACASAHAADTPSAPVPILPEALSWASPPGNPAVRGAWVVGSERAAGPYLFRVRLDSGARIPPHVHSDARNTTVLSGTLWVGFGETVDDARLVAVPAGAVYVAPAGVPHWIAAKEDPVVYQESGLGPTATTPSPHR
ncbi:MAG: cupin domain-containing protein [Deltaproteobacteria bacterium]|nr:cupin domain-containing protein [Deltaproteobacteria bacterium]